MRCSGGVNEARGVISLGCDGGDTTRLLGFCLLLGRGDFLVRDLDDIGQGDAVEIILHHHRGGFPDFVRPASGYLVAARLILDAFDQAACAFQGVEDIADFDLFRAAGESVSASRPANAFNELVDFQRDDDLFKIADGNSFRVRHALEDDSFGAVAVLTGQVDHQTRPVSSLRRKLDHAAFLLLVVSRSRSRFRPQCGLIIAHSHAGFNIIL